MTWTGKDYVHCKNLLVSMRRAHFKDMSAEEALAFNDVILWASRLFLEIEKVAKPPQAPAAQPVAPAKAAPKAVVPAPVSKPKKGKKK